MKTIIVIVIVFLRIIPFYCTLNDNPVKTPASRVIERDTSDLPCCNILNPFTQMCQVPCEGYTSYICYQNGEEVEIMITCDCCKEIWRHNNYQPPSGLPCPDPEAVCPCDPELKQLE